MPVKNRSPAQVRVSKYEPAYPQRAENEMRALQNKRLKELQKVIREAMPEILAIVQEEQDASLVLRQDGYSDMMRRIRNRLRVARDAFSRRVKADPLSREVKRCADYTDRKQLQEWQQSVRSTLGIDIRKDFFTGERYERMVADWTQRNVSYIKSVESSCFDEMEDVIMDAFLKGKSNKELSAEMQRRFSVTKSKADLLACDQISTLNSDLARNRQEAAGVEEYRWLSRKDAAVRECHRELDGKKYRWDNPPEMWYMTKHGRVYTGRHCNPGEDYRCRCMAIPVFDKGALNPMAFDLTKRK